MVDRRVIAAVIAVMVSVVALRVVMSSPADPVDSPGVVEPELAAPSPMPTPLPPSVSSSADVATEPAAEAISDTTTPPTPSTELMDEAEDQAEVAELVDQRRPGVELIETRNDDHGHDGLGAPTAGVLPREEVASLFVLARWAWRFDDDDTRQRDALSTLASPTVVADVAPTEQELQRRVDVNEVSWAIVDSVEVVSESQIVVTFAHHVVSSTTGETVTTRTKTLGVAAGVVLSVAS